MLDLGTLRINIKADSSAAERELDGFQRQTEEAERQTKDSTKGMGDSWKGFASSIKTSLAVGVGAITATVAGLVGASSETQSEMSKLDTAFDESGFSAEAASETYKGFVGILGETDTAVEASNHLAKLCDNEEQLSQWTDIAAGVFATFGDSLPLEGLTEAANETSKTGTVVGSLANALNWAGVSEDEFNEKLALCNDEQDRAQLITDTLNGLYGETGDKYRENNEDLIRYNESQDAMNQALSDLGEKLTPVISDITDFATEIVNNAQPAVQWFVDNLPGVKDTFEKLAPAIGGVVGALGGFKAAVGISSAVEALTGAIKAFKLANEGASVAQALLNGVMAANPFVLIVTLIAGVVGALVTLYMTNEDFRNFVNSAWESIKTTVGGVVDAIVNFFTVTVPQAIQGMIDWFAQLPGQISSFLGSVISSVGSWVGQMASNAANAASEFGSNLINGLASLPGRVVSVGGDIIHGLVNGITGAAGQVIDAIGGVVGDAIDWAKNLLGIHSPSKVFQEIGDFTMQGFEEGIEESVNKVAGAARYASQRVVDAFNPEISVPEHGSGVVDRVSGVLSMSAGGSSAPARYGDTNYNYYIGDTRVDTITEQRFAQEFIQLMNRYGRLAVT